MLRVNSAESSYKNYYNSKIGAQKKPRASIPACTKSISFGMARASQFDNVLPDLKTALNNALTGTFERVSKSGSLKVRIKKGKVVDSLKVNEQTGVKTFFEIGGNGKIANKIKNFNDGKIEAKSFDENTGRVLKIIKTPTGRIYTTHFNEYGKPEKFIRSNHEGEILNEVDYYYHTNGQYKEMSHRNSIGATQTKRFGTQGKLNEFEKVYRDNIYRLTYGEKINNKRVLRLESDMLANGARIETEFAPNGDVVKFSGDFDGLSYCEEYTGLDDLSQITQKYKGKTLTAYANNQDKFTNETFKTELGDIYYLKFDDEENLIKIKNQYGEKVEEDLFDEIEAWIESFKSQQKFIEKQKLPTPILELDEPATLKKGFYKSDVAEKLEAKYDMDDEPLAKKQIFDKFYTIHESALN